MKHTLDGWHKIQGYDVYVEDDKVKIGTTGYGFDYKPIYSYRWNKKLNCWIKCFDLSVAAFSAGVRRGTIEMF